MDKKTMATSYVAARDLVKRLGSTRHLALLAGLFNWCSVTLAIDLNHDGVDDLYAERYGVVGIDPNEDPDIDGASILVESYFNTNPTNANDRPDLGVVHGTLLDLNWPTKTGVAYRVDFSTNIYIWETINHFIQGDQGQATLAVTPSGPFGAYRLGALPQDSDGDGLRDLDESEIGSDPNNPDTDGDGLYDGFEAASPGFDPLTASDPCADVNTNTIADIQEFAATLGTNLVTWVNPGNGLWSTATNWSTGTIPGSNSVVLISPCAATGPVVTVNASAHAAAVFGSATLVISNAQFKLGSQLHASRLELRNAGNIIPIRTAYVSLFLSIAGDMIVESGCVVDVTNDGYPVLEGPGAPVIVTTSGSSPSGGSHGGRGGRGGFTEIDELGHSYGSLTQPTSWGSGANRGGGPGGGAIRIVAGGTLQLDGSLIADAVRTSNSAGAGGSIWVDCDVLSGNGIVRANGANGNSIGGAGGGGRIAIYYDSSSFAGQISARSSLVGIPAGAGSVYTKQQSAPLALLVYDNGGMTGTTQAATTPALPGSLVIDADIIVRNGAVLTSVNGDTLNIATPGTVTVATNSIIEASAQGWPGGSGPGVAPVVDTAGTGSIGGSHGGQGGLGRLITDRTLQGATYGSITAPTNFGSGSNRSTPAGGGAIRIDCATLTVDGTIAADGEDGDGSGAGGSIWITSDFLTGGGKLTANGGKPNANTGGGGGGRFALYVDSLAGFTGSLQARGDNSHSGSTSGGAGSLFVQIGSTRPVLIYDNGGATGGLTRVVGTNLIIDADINISGDARLVGQIGSPLHIETPGVITIASNSFIDASARGYLPYQGPGAPVPPDPSQQANGAGHAGRGGIGWLVTPPTDGIIYGSITNPMAMGSGAASHGGGMIRLIAGSLIVDGGLLVHAESAGAPFATGSGGSLWITCTNIFSGTGLLDASGGLLTGVASPLGGAGSGGRMAVFTPASMFTGTYRAMSPSSRAGAAGTIYVNVAGADSLILDNAGTTANMFTALPRFTRLSNDFIVRGGAIAGRAHQISDPVLEVVAQGEINIATNSRVEYSARAMGQQVDVSFQTFETQTLWGGGSHGSQTLYTTPPQYPNIEGGSYAYDSPYNPRMPGSGGLAGGIIILRSAGPLTVDGTIAVNAGHPAPNPGSLILSSSGGSINLSGSDVLGSGTLSAFGGDAYVGIADVVASGGSGGRIAAYGQTVSTSLNLQLGGGAFAPPVGPSGNPGSYLPACFPLNIVSNALQEIAPPSDIRPDALVSATNIVIFPEHMTFNYADVNGGSNITFDAMDPGMYDDLGDITGVVTQKEICTTYLLHADAPTGTSVVLSASVTFDRDIIGVFATTNSIPLNNNWFGSQLPVFGFNASASAGLELDAGDSFEISPDRRTLTVTFDTSDGMDQLRVVTQPRLLHEWCP